MTTITTQREWTTLSNGKLVRVQQRVVGASFGRVGQVVARNGRVIWESTTVRPMFAVDAALEDAAAAVRRMAEGR